MRAGASTAVFPLQGRSEAIGAGFVASDCQKTPTFARNLRRTATLSARFRPRQPAAPTPLNGVLGVKPARIPDFRAPKAVPVSVCRAGGGEVRRRWPRSGSAASSTSFGLTHAPSHKQTDAVQVGGQYRQCNGVRKPIGTVGANPIETAMFKVVDCRLDRRVLAPCLGKCLRTLALALGH